MTKRIIVFGLFGLLCASSSFADTFTNTMTGEVLHGFAVNRKINSRTMVRTEEKGFKRLKLSLWQIEYNSKGRDDKVIVIPVSCTLKYSAQNKAVIDAIDNATSRGPQFILLELDVAGDNVGMALDLGSAVSKASDFTPVYGYVKGGQTLGAINAGVIPAIACKKLFIDTKAKIGGLNQADANDPNADFEYEYFDMRKALGANVGEKMTSVYRGYVSSLASENGKPGLVAMAMVDPQMHVIQLQQERREYIEAVNLKQGQTKKKVWSQKGELLIADAQAAVESGIADAVVNSRDEVIEKIAGGKIEIEIEDEHISRLAELNESVKRLNQIGQDIEKGFKELKQADQRTKKIKLMALIRLYKKAFAIANKNPDLGLNSTYLKMEIDSLQMKFNSYR